MSEWERAKTQPPQSAEKTEEGAAEATAESQEGQSTSEGESSSQWPPATAGVTYELCAGLVDKPNLTLEEIARQEVLEECGYDVPASKLKRITSYRSAGCTVVCTEPVDNILDEVNKDYICIVLLLTMLLFAFQYLLSSFLLDSCS